MSNFGKSNIENIINIFEEKTGTKLEKPRSKVHPLKCIIAFAVLFCLNLGISVFAGEMLTPLDSDDLSFSSAYEGNGIISVRIQNESDNDLVIQSKLKLMRWTTGEEIEPLNDSIAFSGRKIKAHSTGVVTIDISKAYDIEMLEQPLTDDWYYLILTNNDFAFGQDWTISIEFSETIITPITYPDPPKADAVIVSQVVDTLKPYFENITYDVTERRNLNNDYIDTCNSLLAGFDGNVVAPASPYMTVRDKNPSIVFDESVPLDEQYLLVGNQYATCDYKYKLLASDYSEGAFVISASIPSERYKNSSTELPLLYIFTYEKALITDENDYAFVYGQLNTFAQLEQYKIYEDDIYVCYELSSLIYSDLREYTETFAEQNPDYHFDEQIWQRVLNIYNYYKDKEVIGRLLHIYSEMDFE